MGQESQDTLKIKWDEYSNRFLSRLPIYRIKGLYDDATILCDGNFYPVHRLVLSACSKYFESIFEMTQGRHSVIVLKDVSGQMFEAILDYMYMGEVHIEKDQLTNFLTAAESLEVEGLAIFPDKKKNKKNRKIPRSFFEKQSTSKRNNESDITEPSKRVKTSDETLNSVDQVLEGMTDKNVDAECLRHNLWMKGEQMSMVSGMDGDFDLLNNLEVSVQQPLDDGAEHDSENGASKLTNEELRSLKFIPSGNEVPLFPNEKTLEEYLETGSRKGALLKEAYEENSCFTEQERKRLVVLVVDGIMETYDSIPLTVWELMAFKIVELFPSEKSENYFEPYKYRDGTHGGKLVMRYHNVRKRYFGKKKRVRRFQGRPQQQSEPQHSEPLPHESQQHKPPELEPQQHEPHHLQQTHQQQLQPSESSQ